MLHPKQGYLVLHPSKWGCRNMASLHRWRWAWRFLLPHLPQSAGSHRRLPPPVPNFEGATAGMKSSTFASFHMFSRVYYVEWLKTQSKRKESSAIAAIHRESKHSLTANALQCENATGNATT